MTEFFTSFGDAAEAAAISHPPLGISQDLNWQILCAWCLAEQGLPFGSGSHGICQMHADQLIQAYRASRTFVYSTGQANPSFP